MHNLPENDDDMEQLATQAMFYGGCLLALVMFLFGFVLGRFL